MDQKRELINILTFSSKINKYININYQNGSKKRVNKYINSPNSK